MPNPAYEPHEITWTPEKIRRLWDFYGTSDGHADSYFSRSSGGRVVALARRLTDLSGRVLDFGCGPGHLVEHLLARSGAQQVAGLDFSAASAAEANRRLRHEPRFEGALAVEELPSDLASASFDAVLVCSSDLEELSGFLAEARRVLRPTGALVLTTPNEERLGQQMVCCPECGCTFHKWQHVRSWSAGSLSAALAAHGFRPVAARRTCFGSLPRRLWYRWRGAPPHLMVVARPA